MRPSITVRNVLQLGRRHSDTCHMSLDDKKLVGMPKQIASPENFHVHILYSQSFLFCFKTLRCLYLPLRMSRQVLSVDEYVVMSKMMLGLFIYLGRKCIYDICFSMCCKTAIPNIEILSRNALEYTFGDCNTSKSQFI